MALNVLDINPLEHLTGDIAKSQFNYESILNGLVNWNNSKDDYVTIRLMTTSEPYFRDIQFHTRYYYSKTSVTTFSEKSLGPNKYAYNNRYRMTAGLGEAVILRINAIDLGGVKSWGLYEDVSLYDEIEETEDTGYVDYYQISTKENFSTDLVVGNFIRYSYQDDGKYTVGLFKVIHGDEENKVHAGETIVENQNVERCCFDLNEVSSVGIVPAGSYGKDVFWLYDNTVYIKNKNVEPKAVKINRSDSGYLPYCTVYVPSDGDEQSVHSYGDYVYYGGEFFIYVNELPTTLAPYEEDTVERDNNSEVTIRKYNTDYWKPALLLPTAYTIKGSGTIRYTLDTDVNGFVLRNNSALNDSNEKTEIGVTGSLKLFGNPTKEHSGVDIFYTSNYVEWPGTAYKWVEGSSYQTDASKSAYSLQLYSATMVFNHADPTVKRRNIINYDGPDLDQGLCIMLPCEVETEENNIPVIKKPTDGMMFEFILNIWPNHAYDGREYNDLIINKSQIYVYSVKNWSDYKRDGMSTATAIPIAKFSMARLLNFYVHDENVGVPDRPVVYKASFIYSESEERWKTYDYYQFPDHVLMSPMGFVDPMSKEAYDVQSAGFPLFANPFSNYDLSPIHVSDAYKNQIQEDPREQ